MSRSCQTQNCFTSRNFRFGKIKRKLELDLFLPKRKTIIQPEFYQKANELKVIVEESIDLLWAEENAEKINEKCELFLQPEWSQRETILPLIVNYILLHPKWKISLQSHKYMRIP